MSKLLKLLKIIMKRFLTVKILLTILIILATLLYLRRCQYELKLNHRPLNK
jgi:hypothetical protein